MSRRVNGDEIISALLDELVDLTGWSPESIFPEYTLATDLELCDVKIEQLARNLGARLSCVETLDYSTWRTNNLRQIVHQIRQVRGAEGLVPPKAA